MLDCNSINNCNSNSNSKYIGIKKKKLFIPGDARKEMNNALYLNAIAMKYRYEQMKISEITNKINPQKKNNKRKKVGFHLGPNFDKDLIQGQQILQEIKKKRLIDKDYEYELQEKSNDNQKKQIEDIKIASALFNQYMDKMGKSQKISSTFDQFHSFEYDYLDSFLNQVKNVFRHEVNTNKKQVMNTAAGAGEYNTNKSSMSNINNNLNTLRKNNTGLDKKESPQLKTIRKFSIYIGEKPECSKRKQTIEKINKMMIDLKQHKSTNRFKFTSEEGKSYKQKEPMPLSDPSRNRTQLIQENEENGSLQTSIKTHDHHSSSFKKNYSNFNIIHHEFSDNQKKLLIKGINSTNSVMRTCSEWNINKTKIKSKAKKSLPISRNNNSLPSLSQYNSERIIPKYLGPDKVNSIKEFIKFLQMKTHNEKILKSSRKKSKEEQMNEMKITYSKLMFLQNNITNFISHCGRNFCTNIDHISHQ